MLLLVPRTVPCLITPHGDWKPPSQGGPIPYRTPSLPLMGIGNALWLSCCCGRVSTSLPLMGIGNPTAASWGTRLPLSLPLMGIGNAGGRAGGGGAHGLITPHGDWKRRQRRRRGRRLIGSHYPSWGLETRAGREFPVTKFFLLITPHGDWKPRRDSGRPPSISTPHYPSWGLETRGWWRLAIRPCGPHYPSWGLETQCSAAAGSCRWWAHYPSWGLETSINSSLHALIKHSLPLMGIGNSRGAPIRRTVGTTSLPLMGIGNRRADPGDGGGRGLLITPHGDWKLGQVAEQGRRVGTGLITPHGDWKHAIRGLSSFPHSYLITPHGDWKPDVDDLR